MDDTQVLDRLEEEVQAIRRTLRHQYAPIPDTHKYALTRRTVTVDGEEVRYCPVGIRLVTGRRPEDLSPQRLARAAQDAPSRRTVERLATGDDDCVLQSLKIGGRSYVTEASIQWYERGLAEGWVEGYQVIEKVKYNT